MGAQLKPKNSSGIDNISSKQLKEILPSIVNPVTHIFNLSFQTGYIPLELKLARVVSVHKSDSNSLFNNYRPISLLPSLSKLLEKCAAKQMFGFIEKNKILYDFQFGFRRYYNTTQPVLQFLDKIYHSLHKDDPEYTISIFLDLKKAFDTVSHSILLEKLKHYGFRGLSNLWFTNYLNGRKQVVSINGIDSDSLEICVGVPQGSVLGPLLFLLYINCLPNAVEFLALLFADDTTFQMCGNDIKKLFEKTNIELNKAAEWFHCNKSLNVDKTKFIVFKPTKKNADFNNLTLEIGGKKIKGLATIFRRSHLSLLGSILMRICLGIIILAKLKVKSRLLIFKLQE